MGRSIGLWIGAGFGVLFVVLNSGEPVGSAASALLRAVAVVMFIAIVALTVSGHRSNASETTEARATASSDRLGSERFGPRYRLVVAAEIALLFGGFQVIRLLDSPSQTGVAWVAVVVGVHFIALCKVWKEPSILVPGVALSTYGVVGLIVVSTDLVEWVPLISGVLSGMTLLTCGLFFAVRVFTSRRLRTESPSQW